MHSRDEVEKTGENFVFPKSNFVFAENACPVGQNTGMMASSADYASRRHSHVIAGAAT
jgi:hypothetical protein